MKVVENGISILSKYTYPFHISNIYFSKWTSHSNKHFQLYRSGIFDNLLLWSRLDIHFLDASKDLQLIILSIYEISLELLCSSLLNQVLFA
jgi:hypothetical protein